MTDESGGDKEENELQESPSVYDKLSKPHKMKAVEMGLTEFDLALILEDGLDGEYKQYSAQVKQQDAQEEIEKAQQEIEDDT